MSIFNAIILGAVQGLTEFLPVSSSGHLVLLQKVFGISEPALFFDTMVHMGTLAAVLTVLRREIWAILRRFVQPLTAYLVIATVPAVIFALALKKNIEAAFESGGFLGFAFLITATLIITAEFLSRRAKMTEFRKAESMNWLDAVIIGIMQAIAITPGISRSGATISGALSRKLDRSFAARFSFLLSIPAILGAVALQTKDLLKGADSHTVVGAGAVIAGTLTAAVVGFFAVRFMLKIISEKSLWGFAVYTGVLGIMIIIDQYVTHFIEWAL
ncbi:MAG: undecaprenyl-diphosphate phosphatase [Treponema sp.]|jgi:undecaprenyl-diphosphatase|nr:undecaprenyl-diphosphate phosphatase [Treponema sp.]